MNGVKVGLDVDGLVGQLGLGLVTKECGLASSNLKVVDMVGLEVEVVASLLII